MRSPHATETTDLKSESDKLKWKQKIYKKQLYGYFSKDSLRKVHLLFKHIDETTSPTPNIIIPIRNLHSVKHYLPVSYWKHIPRLHHVNSFDLLESQEVVDEFIHYAAANPHLVSLNINADEDDDPVIFDLPKNFPRLMEAMPNLRELHILFNFSDEHLPAIFSLKHLSKLVLRNCNLTAAGFQQLFDKLGDTIKRLTVCGALDSIALGQAMAASKKPLRLQSLSIDGDIFQEFFVHVNQALRDNKLPQLSVMNVSENGFLGSESRQEISTFLRLFKGTFHTDAYDATLALIDDKSSVTKLSFDSESPIYPNFEYKENHSVMELSLATCEWITAVPYLKRLEKLIIQDAPANVDYLLHALRNSSCLPNLKYLHLEGLIVTKKSANAISALNKRSPNPIELKLGVVDITQDHLNTLLTSECLTSLQISSGHVTNLDKVKDCKSLRSLYLNALNADLTALHSCTNLQKLVIDVNYYSSGWVSPQLKKLFNDCIHRMNIYFDYC